MSLPSDLLPIITFKAGTCDFDGSLVKSRATPGYIYLYLGEDELVHFCWRPRSIPHTSPQLDLTMVPGDGQFLPYKSENPKAKANARIFILKFSSSSQRHAFWLQSKSQSPTGDPNFFGARDIKIGQIVDQLLQGEDVDVATEISRIANSENDRDEDEVMEDVDTAGHGSEFHPQGGSGGAGPGATGGDIREEGEGPREGGADGGRAGSTMTNDASAVVQNFLKSLGSVGTQQEKPFTTLPELLSTSSTIPIIEEADEATLDMFLSYLPPSLISLEQAYNSHSSKLDVKKATLEKVLRSPQFSTSLATLTVALSDGGLPSVSDALNIKVANGGFTKRGGVPLGGGQAVKAFLEGVKKQVKDEKFEQGDKMQRD
ncbi:MAG: hypothetical protein M1829_004048 [Trizodia sp. TS-e1964]|nr:MAG: hypothetical protein M1829_004048 [Trizodia sp. TS-e1964]